MTRRVNAEGRALLKQWEGLRLEAYQDGGGVWTIGYGHTRTAQPGMKITTAKAKTLFNADIAPCEEAVERLVTVELNDNQFAALVSFVYNVGEGAFTKSTLLKKLNAGDYDAVPAQLMRWVKDNGKVVDGLVNRRAAESGLWARGSFVTSAGPTTAQPETPPLLTKENLTTAAGAIGAMGTAASAVVTGEGPVQYAFAAVIVVALLIGAFLVLRKRLRPS